MVKITEKLIYTYNKIRLDMYNWTFFIHELRIFTESFCFPSSLHAITNIYY